MTTKTAELSFQEAADEALAEEDLAGSDDESANSSGKEQNADSEGEQSAVENAEDTGLFSDLQDEMADGEQPDLDSLTVDVNGTRVSVNELTKGYMRQGDYTQKTQQLADERAESEKAIALYKSIQDDPEGTIRQLYAQTVQGQTPVEQSTTPKSPDIAALVEQQVKDQLENDPRLQAYESSTSAANIDATFERIEKTFDLELNEGDRVHVMEKAVELGTPNLEFVFEGLMHQLDRVRAEQDNVEKVSTTSGRRSDPTDKKPATPKSFDSVQDAWDEVLAEEGISL